MKDILKKHPIWKPYINIGLKNLSQKSCTYFLVRLGISNYIWYVKAIKESIVMKNDNKNDSCVEKKLQPQWKRVPTKENYSSSRL